MIFGKDNFVFRFFLFSKMVIKNFGSIKFLSSFSFSNNINSFHNIILSNADFAEEWAAKFSPTEPRVRLFETILKQIEEAGCAEKPILELGIGPGYLAGYLLDRLPKGTYLGLDYSKAMLEIARNRTAAHKNRIDFICADLIHEAWNKKIEITPDVIVSTWALHDLFEKENDAHDLRHRV